VAHMGDGEKLEIVFFSGDRPEGVVGINAAWGLVDEAGHQKDELLKNARARVRHPKAKLLQYAELGTPEEFNGFYEFCEGKPPDGLHLIRARTQDNFFLVPSPEEYIKQRFSHFTDEERQRYMEGRFVARHGRVYSYYNPNDHEVECKDILDGEQVICADFGSRTVAWAFGSIKDIGGVERLHIWGELVGQATNTWDHLEEAKDYLKRAWTQATGVSTSWDEVAAHTTVHCDAAGQFREYGDGTTNSDVEILYEAGLTVSMPRRNPLVMDRVYSVQDLMRKRGPDGLPLLLVDPKRAKYVTECFGRQGFDKWGRPEKSKDNLTGKRGLDHGADAVGYCCHARWPVSAPRGNDVSFRT